MVLFSLNNIVDVMVLFSLNVDTYFLFFLLFVIKLIRLIDKILIHHRFYAILLKRSIGSEH